MGEIVDISAKLACRGRRGYDLALTAQLMVRRPIAPVLSADKVKEFKRGLIGQRMESVNDDDAIITGGPAFLPDTPLDPLADALPPLTYTERLAAKFEALAEKVTCSDMKQRWQIQARDAGLCRYREPEYQLPIAPEPTPIQTALRFLAGLIVVCAALLLMVAP